MTGLLAQEPLGGMRGLLIPIDPEEVADLVAFLLSDRSRAIVGFNLFIDGGMSSQLLGQPPFEFRQI